MRSTALHSLIFAMAASVSAHATEAGAPGKTLGFAIIDLPFSLAKNAEDCPDGFAMSAKETFLASVAQAERERLQKPENLKEFEQKAYFTPDGKDFCSVPTYPRAPQRTPQGKMSFGMNLDGTTDGHATSNSCAHQKFQGADGQPVDNQLYRVIGCVNELKTHTLTDRPPLQLNYWNVLYEQMPAWLIEISNIEDPQNSPDVTVTITRAFEPPTKDSAGNVESDLTFTSDPNPRWHNVVHGRIKDGVLTTDKFEMNMEGDPFWIQEFHFKEARLRLKIAPDGSLRGFLGGYHAWFPFYWQYGSEGWGVDATNNVDLPGFYFALKNSADAYPDPKTGQNTAISSAWLIEAVPAFVAHPAETGKQAATEGQPTKVGSN